MMEPIAEFFFWVAFVLVCAAWILSLPHGM
jgi:hypothetical protein